MRSELTDVLVGTGGFLLLTALVVALMMVPLVGLPDPWAGRPYGTCYYASNSAYRAMFGDDEWIGKVDAPDTFEDVATRAHCRIAGQAEAP